MSTDLVERLRAVGGDNLTALWSEAAAEIERLRDVQMYDRNLIKALTMDNERLRAQNAELKEARCNMEHRLNTDLRMAAAKYVEVVESGHREIERLRAALRDALIAWQEGRDLNEKQILAALEGK